MAAELAAWERELRDAIAVYDVIAAGDAMLGRVSAECERAREAVVGVMDRALASGVSEQAIDAALESLRREAGR